MTGTLWKVKMHVFVGLIFGVILGGCIKNIEEKENTTSPQTQGFDTWKTLCDPSKPKQVLTIETGVPDSDTGLSSCKDTSGTGIPVASVGKDLLSCINSGSSFCAGKLTDTPGAEEIVYVCSGQDFTLKVAENSDFKVTCEKNN